MSGNLKSMSGIERGSELEARMKDLIDTLYSVSEELGVPLEELTEEEFFSCIKDNKGFAGTVGFKPLKETVLRWNERAKKATNPIKSRSALAGITEETIGRSMVEKMKEVDKSSFRPSDLTRYRRFGISKADEVAAVLDTLLETGELGKDSYTGKYTIKQTKKDSFNENDLEEGYRDRLEEEIKKYKRFVITTAVVGKPVNEDFLNSIKNYAERTNSLVLVLPSDVGNSNKRRRKTDKQEAVMELDPRLKDFKVVYKDLYLNRNLCVCAIKTSAKQINPLTGLQRMATRKDASIILGSTKLFEDNIPCKKDGIPHRVSTTGAITVNNYDTDNYMSMRTSYIAEEDHMYGAAVVELEDDHIFHLRLVEGSAEGTFTDMGVEYRPDGSVSFPKNNVFVMGDSHTEMLDYDLHKKVMEFVDSMNVRTVVLHDSFNGTSITHHDKGKLLTRALKAMESRLSLESEGEALKKYIEVIKTHVPEVVIVRSNHDRHLDTYLEEGRFMTDPINTYAGIKLAKAYLEGRNPLQYLLEDMLELEGKGIIWLKQDESYNRFGIELGAHGDKGANGGRGSLTTFERSVGNCVTAHTHAAKRLRRACCVGTVGYLDQGYNEGLSSWSRTCCICYSNGTKQLIHFILNKKGQYSFGDN